MHAAECRIRALADDDGLCGTERERERGEDPAPMPEVEK
jgi:hypothetical protein